MILNRVFYSKISRLRSIWNSQLIRKISAEKAFRAFRLHKTEWPNKLYFYSPRLKRVPRFSGDVEVLRDWKESKLCETICPTQAIKVTASAFIINERGCIACGLCVELAPPGLLEMTSVALGTRQS
jgi:Fe-S-cluster-containing hydrogenase component 2